MHDTWVYRSTHPEVVALEEKWRAEHDEYAKAVRRFKRKWPIKDSRGKVLPLMESRGFDRHVAGYEWFASEAPEGWRVDRKHSTLTPKRTSKIGKEIAADMDRCRLRDPRRDLTPLGMPSFSFGSARGGIGLLHPGVEFHEGACYVIWSKEMRPRRADTEGYDPDIWAPVKLSEFYAVKERVEARAG